MTTYPKDTIKDLIDGKLPWETLHRIISDPKDGDRFSKYLDILQERVPFKERILLPLTDHLYIVQKGDARIVKCDCGHEFGDYRQNWKLNASIFVRDSDDTLDEIWIGPRKGEDPRRCEIREYYCPGCQAQLEVEALPPSYPIIFDFLPDLDTFYSKWLGKPLADGAKSATPSDRTYEVTAEWAKG